MFRQFAHFHPMYDVDGTGGGGASGGGAQGGGSDGGNQGEAGKGSSGENKGGEGQQSGSNNEPEKKFTQADIDKHINATIAKERKKFEKQIEDLKKQFTAGGDGEGNANAGGQNNNQQQQQTSEEAQKAATALAVANARLVKSSAVIEAVKLGVDPKYTEAVVKLADLSKVEVKDDGSIDTNAIAKQLDEVLKQMPMFKTQTQQQGGGFQVGGEGNKQGQGNGWNNNQQNQGQQKRWNRNR